MHVDEFIDDIDSVADPHLEGPKRYAQFFFLLARLPAWQKSAFRKWTEQFKLFCTYEGQRYRVTGASRMGDVWLNPDFRQSSGYEHRVDLADCSDWSAEP